MRAGLVEIDRATILAAQLEALLANSYGTGGEALRSLDEEIQDNYAWLAADLASALRKALLAACDSEAA